MPILSSEKTCRISRGWVVSLLVVGLFLSLFVGCVSVGPNYEKPESNLADSWNQAIMADFQSGEPTLETWWTLFNDPLLNELIQKAESGNLNLKIALARIDEAAALRGIAKSDWFPQVTGSGNAQKTQLSEGTNPNLPEGADRTGNLYQLGLGVSWELDFWGRVRRSVESATASFEATTEDYRDALVLLYADVASSYIEVRTLQERIRYARENIKLQQGTMSLTTNRYRAGLSSILDVRQAELNLGVTESAIPTLQNNLTRAMNRLGVLTGQSPSALWSELSEEGQIPDPPTDVIVGVPVDVLRQRPDVRSAERGLAAQNARIGVAKADLFPTFSLPGVFTLESLETSDLLKSTSLAYGFGPSFQWRIFSAGAVLNNIRAEEARTRQALHNYEQVVLQAVEDVENAMASFAQEKDRFAALQRAVAAARESVELTKTLYKSGLTDFQNVLDMERSLALQEDNLASSEGQFITYLIQLYAALGGGWNPDGKSAPKEIVATEKVSEKEGSAQ